MLWYQALILGIVQGLTEFLPISSSGHLILVPEILGWQIQSLTFDVTVHLGTTLAVILFFYKELRLVFRSVVFDYKTHGLKIQKYSENSELLFYMFLASFPAVIAGILFSSTIELNFRNQGFVMLFLIIGSIIMAVAELSGNYKSNKVISWGSALLIGIFQSFALLPGMSRSGATISGGMLKGLSREDAARFSFLLSIPIIVAAAFMKIFLSIPQIDALNIVNMLIGFVTSFVSGYISIKFLIKFLSKHSLGVFIVYRILLVLVLFTFF